MSLKIRMTRGGAKKRPFYRIVSPTSRAPRDGRFIEKIGTYNPMLAHDDPERVKLRRRAHEALAEGRRPAVRPHRHTSWRKAGLRPMPAQPRADAASICRRRRRRSARKAAADAAAKPRQARRRDAPARANGRTQRELDRWSERILIGVDRRRPWRARRGADQELHRRSGRGRRRLWSGDRRERARAASSSASIGQAKGGVIARIDGIADRNAAEALQGLRLYVAAHGAAGAERG